ncbi:cation diffusion facilitator family transporter [Chitinophagaceae bacterium 26-R-25]|nr:cation diffusion facilitator family transporter [Chitinophagaceae bacterium 26-R-25]
MNSAQVNIRIQKIVVTVAIFLFIVKIIAYFLTKSVSILTDALESIVNVVAGCISLYSLFVAAKPRDIDHPYGHGKAEFLSAAVEGTLISIAGAFIIYKSILNFINPQEIHKVDYGILMIVFAGVVNWFVGAYAINQGKKSNSVALVAGGKHLQSDTYSTIGIVVGLVLIYFTHLVIIDSIVAAIFGLIIIFTGYKIIRSSIAGIMDEADMELLGKLVKVLNQNRRPNWVDLHNLRVIKYGAVLHIDCHLTVPWYLNVIEAHKEIDGLIDLITKNFGESVEFFVHTDACLNFSCAICIKEDCNARLHPFEKRIEWTLENIISNKKHSLSN